MNTESTRLFGHAIQLTIDIDGKQRDITHLLKDPGNRGKVTLDLYRVLDEIHKAQTEWKRIYSPTTRD